ncbi:MAG: hypothetical protein JWP50_286, partial [Phenylobacterium sp.]|nr:hypothetical protein [Phenylobacterium sp.]
MNIRNAAWVPAFAGMSGVAAPVCFPAPRTLPAAPMSTSPAAEAARRRTFAIISHPDAG